MGAKIGYRIRSPISGDWIKLAGIAPTGHVLTEWVKSPADATTLNAAQLVQVKNLMRALSITVEVMVALAPASTSTRIAIRDRLEV